MLVSKKTNNKYVYKFHRLNVCVDLEMHKGRLMLSTKNSSHHVTTISAVVRLIILRNSPWIMKIVNLAMFN